MTFSEARRLRRRLNECCEVATIERFGSDNPDTWWILRHNDECSPLSYEAACDWVWKKIDKLCSKGHDDSVFGIVEADLAAEFHKRSGMKGGELL